MSLPNSLPLSTLRRRRRRLKRASSFPLSASDLRGEGRLDFEHAVLIDRRRVARSRLSLTVVVIAGISNVVARRFGPVRAVICEIDRGHRFEGVKDIASALGESGCGRSWLLDRELEI